MRFTITVAALLLAAAAGADPVITSITPNQGGVAGGTTVTIKGSGFSNICIICSPIGFVAPEVLFQGTPAASVKFVDTNTLEAITPPHLPARVPVTVRQLDGSKPFTLQDGFEFVGDPNSAFDAILFPIFTGPVKGAFGSEFHTTARLWNEDLSTIVSLYGIDTSCYLIDPPVDPMNPFMMAPSGDEQVLLPGCSTTTGRLFWVPKGRDTLAGNLRVRDVTRQATSHGVEIPVVHGDDFSEERISLLGVPIDPRFRNTLRIYSLARGPVLVNVRIGNESRQVFLQPARDLFEPAFATITDFPAGPSTTRVVIDVAHGPIGETLSSFPIWAFITVTNNETQEITTITPN